MTDLNVGAGRGRERRKDGLLSIGAVTKQYGETARLHLIGSA